MSLFMKDIRQTQEYDILINICVCVDLFSPSLVDGYLNCFQFYSVTKHDTINILIHGFWCTRARPSLCSLSESGSTAPDTPVHLC